MNCHAPFTDHVFFHLIFSKKISSTRVGDGLGASMDWIGFFELDLVRMFKELYDVDCSLVG